MSNINIKIEQITKMGEEKQRQMIRHLSRFELDVKLQIFDNQKSIFHQTKQNYQDIANNILTYCSLILAISNHIKSDTKFDIKVLAIKRKYDKRANKRDKILERWAIVKTLKINQNFSFRQIAIYLKKHHKIDVAHSTIFAAWQELEN